jgi:hypothetical protein
MLAYKAVTSLSPFTTKTSFFIKFILRPDINLNTYNKRFKLIAFLGSCWIHRTVSSTYYNITIPLGIKSAAEPTNRPFFLAVKTILVKHSPTILNKVGNWATTDLLVEPLLHFGNKDLTHH